MGRVARPLMALLVAAGAIGQVAGVAGVAGQTLPVAVEDGRGYDAYVPTVTKAGQFFDYSCEFDAAWVILDTFGYDVPFAEQLEIVGHDQDVEPYYEQTASGFVIHGGDITSAFSGDFTSNLLARTTGRAMRPLFEEFGLGVDAVDSREGIEAALDDGSLIWMKATVDFLPWEPVIWLTPEGDEIETVLGNDHAVVVVGYDDEVVVIRDVLGPTTTNWERPDQYEVPWDTFLAVWGAQGNDGLAVSPTVADDGPRRVERPESGVIDPFDVDGKP